MNTGRPRASSPRCATSRDLKGTVNPTNRFRTTCSTCSCEELIDTLSAESVLYPLLTYSLSAAEPLDIGSRRQLFLDDVNPGAALLFLAPQ